MIIILWGFGLVAGGAVIVPPLGQEQHGKTTLHSERYSGEDGGRRFYDEDAGLSHGHATQILQGEDGFLWIATWNGLNRFDGYEFVRVGSLPGDGCGMGSDRMRDIWGDGVGGLYCLVEDDELYHFDGRTYVFRDVCDEVEVGRALRLRGVSRGRGVFDGEFIRFRDGQGLLWTLRGDGIVCDGGVGHGVGFLGGQCAGETRCMGRDGRGRIWVATKEGCMLQLYDEDLVMRGYVSPRGEVCGRGVSWMAPIYCFTETRDGTIWLGSKGGGLFRVRERGLQMPLRGDSVGKPRCTVSGFSVERIGGLACENVYDVKEDGWGRLWVATLGGGVSCVTNPGAAVPEVVNGVGFGGSSLEGCGRVRFLLITEEGVLLAATTGGLLVSKIEENVGRMRFRRHCREGDREESLVCNATMDITRGVDGRLFVSTETGGLLEIMSKDVTAERLSFRRVSMKGGVGTGVMNSVTVYGERMLIVGSKDLTVYDEVSGTGTVFGRWFFNHGYRFNEVRPLILDDGRCLVATKEGTCVVDLKEMRRDGYVPKIVLTSMRIGNGELQTAVNHLDTLLLSPSERSLTIHFAAIDFRNPKGISYAFRLEKDTSEWHSIGREHSVSMLNLSPGTYELCLRSTNAGGVWVNNVRRIVIVAEPTFWETGWATVLVVLAVVSVICIVVYTIWYIRKIKRQQEETLEKYLMMLEGEGAGIANALEQAMEEQRGKTTLHSERGEGGASSLEQGQRGETTLHSERDGESDVLMRGVVKFVEENMGNADMSVSDMAEACAVSRSVLQRKMKHLLGVTPADFVRAARMKHACQLLLNTGLSISEIAFRCGFNDPKYFSRTFKKHTGVSPTDYQLRGERQGARIANPL